MKKIKYLLLIPTLSLISCGNNGGDKPQEPVEKWKAIEATEMKTFIDEFYGNLNLSFFIDEKDYIDFDITDECAKINESVNKDKAGYHAYSYSGSRSGEEKEDSSYEISDYLFGYDNKQLIQYGYNIDEYKDVGVDRFVNECWAVIEDEKEYIYLLKEGVCEKELLYDLDDAVEKFIDFGVTSIGEDLCSFSVVAFDTIAAVSLGVNNIKSCKKHYKQCTSIGSIGELGELIEGGINFEYEFFKADDGSYKIIETLNRSSATVDNVDFEVSGSATFEYRHEVVFGKHFIESEKLNSTISFDMDYGDYSSKETYTDILDIEYIDDYKLKPVPTEYVWAVQPE